MKKVVFIILAVLLMSGCSFSKSPINPKKELVSNKEAPFKGHMDSIWYDEVVTSGLEGTDYNDVSIYVPEDDRTLSRYRYVNHERLLSYDEIVEEWIEKESQSNSKELHQEYVPKLVMEEIGTSGFLYVKEKVSDPKWRKNAVVSNLREEAADYMESYGEKGVIEDAFMYEHVWLYFFSNNGDLRKLYIPKLAEIIEMGFNDQLTIKERLLNREISLNFLQNKFNDPEIATYLQYTYNISPKNFYIHLKDFSDYLEINKAIIDKLRDMDEEQYMHFMYIEEKWSFEKSIDVYRGVAMTKYKGSLEIDEISDNMSDYRVFY